MALFERTAYPRLKQNLTKTELRDFYTPPSEEIEFVRQTARKEDTQLHLLVHLKLFEQLGYFLNIEDVPELLISHLRSALQDDIHTRPFLDREALVHGAVFEAFEFGANEVSCRILLALSRDTPVGACFQ